MWKVLKSLGLPKKSLHVKWVHWKSIKQSNIDTNLVLGGFKDYYSELPGKILKKLPKPPNKLTFNAVVQHYKGIIQSDSFNLGTVSENIILTILKNTNVSETAGLDRFSYHLNLSITSGKFLDSYKIVKLKPIYKKGSLTEASNYRPISLLPLISKVIEKVIHDQASAFLTSGNLLYSYRSGFCKNHSSDYCLSFLNDKILKAFYQSLMTDMILIYLETAFEKIDRDIQLQKFYALGFSKHSVNWFRSYLINRTTLVNWVTHFLNLHACPVVYRKHLFLAVYSFSYVLMICHKLSNVIFFFTLTVHALSVNKMILMKLENI